MSTNTPRVVITGATDGIGLETARQLRRRGARVDVHGRTPSKVAAVSQELGGAGWAADLADVSAVRAFADEVRADGQPIDVLLLNAGIFATELARTGDGRELTLAVNHDANVLLVERLLERVAASTLKRVVVVSSVAHTRGELDLTDLDWRRRPYGGYAAYAASKLANLLFAVELARQVAPRGVTVNALHPGVVTTKLLKKGFNMEGFDTLEAGAQTSVFLALDAPAGVSGRYFDKRSEAASHPLAKDAHACRAFWDASRLRVGLPPEMEQ